MMGVLRRSGRRCLGRSHVMTEAEMSWCSQTTGGQGLLVSARHWKEQGRTLPQSCQMDHNPARPLTSDFWPPDCERVSFVFSAPSLWCFAAAALGRVHSICALSWFDCNIMCMLSPIRLFATPWTVAHQDPLSMGFPRQEYWSGLPCPLSGDLPNSGIEPMSLMSPATAGGFFTTEPPGKPCNIIIVFIRLTPYGFVLSPSL